MVKLSDIDLPVTFKRHLLFKSGNWNNWTIKPEEVNKSVNNTKWNKINSSLIYSHKDNEAEAWVGNVKNVFAENGAVYGDLEIWDPDTALKAKYGEAAFAVSAGIAWPDIYDQPTNFFYRNFSLVTNPGVMEKDIFLNFSAKGNLGEYKIATFSSSLNEDLSSFDNTQKEQVTEQITPLENDKKEEVEIKSEEIKPEEIKQEIKEPEKVEETPIQEIVEENHTPQEININERGLQETSSMESEKESQNNNVTEKVEVKETAKPTEEVKEISPEIDEKVIDSIVDKLAEKININPNPAPITTNEFGGNVINSEEAVVDRLVNDLFKQ